MPDSFEFFRLFIYPWLNGVNHSKGVKGDTMLVTKKTTLLLIMRGRGTNELRKKQFYKVETKSEDK